MRPRRDVNVGRGLDRSWRIHARRNTSRDVVRHVGGRKLADVAMPSTGQADVSLAAIARRQSLVICFYPRLMLAKDAERDPHNARALRWTHQQPILEGLEHDLVTVASQAPEHLLQWAYRLDIQHLVLSDLYLVLARTLALPTSEVRGTWVRIPWVYEPVTILVRHERVVRVTYPAGVDDADQTTNWIRRTYGR